MDELLALVRCLKRPDEKGVPQGLTYDEFYASPLFKDAFADMYREKKDVTQEWADSHQAVYAPWDACCVEHLDNPPDGTRPGEFFARGERVLARYVPYAPPANPSVEEKKDDGGERDSDEPEGSVGAATEESEAGGWFLARHSQAKFV